MASATGTILGGMAGSCLPFISISAASLCARSTVFCLLPMEGVGLTAIRQTMGSPVDMPPKMPPARLLSNTTRSSCHSRGSFISLPLSPAHSLPAPISTAFTAPMPIRARARSASSLSNTGSPRPGGTPSAIISTTPPRLSPSFLTSSSRFSILSAATGSGQRTAFDSAIDASCIKSRGGISALTPPSSVT